MNQIAHRFAFLLLVGLLSAGGVLAGDRLTLEDTFEIEMAMDPQVSPAGDKVVYVRSFADSITDRRYGNLWMVDFDGGNHRGLTTGDYSDGSPRWSPQGDRIAFISDRDGSAQIYVYWFETGRMARLTQLKNPPFSLAWSPDGNHLSFVSLVPDPGPSIAKMPPPPKGAKWAEPAVLIDRLSYRFDGAGFLTRGSYQVFVLEAEGGTPRQVTSGDFQHGGRGFRASDPVWAPDGKSIIVSANRRPDWELEPLDTEIHEFPLDGGPVRTLTSRFGPDSAPAISSDGRWIAYVGFDDRYQGHQTTHLYLLNRETGESRQLAAELDRSIQSPTWASDGSGIYFLYDDQGNTRLAFQPMSGTLRVLTGDVGGTGSAYSGGSFSLSNNGRYAFTVSTPWVPGDIAVGSLGGEASRQVTFLNRDLFEGKKLGEVEEIWYESSLDQKRIQGWIIKPPDFDPTRKYPLILEIHGGPFANYGDRFDLEKQVWAAGDYVVLYVNPRGSTSYGEEFGNLIHHAYPGDDFFDLNSGVDAVLARGYIDAEELYVTGGSGGGVLTAWMIGRTDRFRAAVSVYPVINWYSWVLTADISSFGVKYWFPGFPWDNVEHYEKRSLLSVVKNVKTPTMVLTGEADYRTPMSESEQYYQALKLLGVESVLVRVPDEPHGIRVRPSHHMQKIAYIQGWFDTHRKK